MKYGESLQDWSAPQWAIHNIDYAGIKNMIKAHTSDAKSSNPALAVDVPGQSSQPPEWTGDLSRLVAQEVERVDLFYFSKCGELERRMLDLERALARQVSRNASKSSKSDQHGLSIRHPDARESVARNRSRRQEGFSRLESATLRVGEDLQALARYVAAQRRALQKLTKKFRRWTGSDALVRTVQGDIFPKARLLRPTRLALLSERYARLLQQIRTAYDQIHLSKGSFLGAVPGGLFGGTVGMPSRLPHPIIRYDGTVAPDLPSFLVDATAHGADMALDAVLSSLPVDQPSVGHRTYWVHPDNVLPLQILLQTHLRLLPPSTALPSKQGRQALQTPNSPTIATPCTTTDGPDFRSPFSLIACRSLKKVLPAKSTKTDSRAAAASHGPSSSPAYSHDCPCLRLLAVSQVTCLAALCTAPKSRSHDQERFLTCASLPLRHVSRLFGSHDSGLLDTESHITTSEEQAQQGQSPANQALEDQAQDSGDAQSEQASAVSRRSDLSSISSWLHRHAAVQPLVQVDTLRSRYMSGSTLTDDLDLAGSVPSSGLWALMDETPEYRQTNLHDVLQPEKEFALVSFPYAVLNLSWIDTTVPAASRSPPPVVTLLDQSHLCHAVDNFTLENHALATLVAGQDLAALPYGSDLQQDIRRLPTPNLMSPSSRSSRAPTAASSRSSSIGRAAGNSIWSSAGGMPSSGTSRQDSSSSAAGAQRGKYRNRGLPNNPNDLTLHVPYSNTSTQPKDRYWNEYEHDQQGQQEANVYTIFVDPDAKDPLVELWQTVTQPFRKMASAVRHRQSPPLSPKASATHATSDERRPLRQDTDHNGRISYVTFSHGPPAHSRSRSRSAAHRVLFGSDDVASSLASRCRRLAIAAMTFALILAFLSMTTLTMVVDRRALADYDAPAGALELGCVVLAGASFLAAVLACALVWKTESKSDNDQLETSTATARADNTTTASTQRTSADAARLETEALDDAEEARVGLMQSSTPRYGRLLALAGLAVVTTVDVIVAVILIRG